MLRKLYQFVVGLFAHPGPTASRMLIAKSVCWLFVGIGFTVALARFIHGLGSSTALTDTTPWGFWIGFDVVGGVALAAGGFVMAAVVYIFQLERYRPIVRPAVLTACLGYFAVAVGLIFDLGLPWNIWHPTIYWQYHSALFEVAWCVMLYLTVLVLEFAPVVLEKMPFPGLYKFIKKLTLPLVVLGIMLSTLHQSSLGTLFLIMPYRLHPLWFSSFQPLFFFVSAIGLGLCMVMLESLLTSWLYRRQPEVHILRGLAGAAAVVIAISAVMKLGDLFMHGNLHYIYQSAGWESAFFIVEMIMWCVIPVVALGIPRFRNNLAGLWLGAGCGVAGFVFNRLNISITASIKSTGSHYFPSWTEFAISLAVVCGFVLVFFFLVERFNVYEEPPEVSLVESRMPFNVFSGARVYSMIFILGAAVAFGFLPSDAIHGASPAHVAAHSAQLIQADPDGSEEILLIDGNRNGSYVVFNHGDHAKRQEACTDCHHANLPLEMASRCAPCHSDMYSEASIFDHAYHMEKMGGNSGCVNCHADMKVTKSADTAASCVTCHEELSTIKSYRANGYMEAMHESCIKCHREKLELSPDLGRGFAECAHCHGDDSAIDEKRKKLYKGEDLVKGNQPLRK